MTVRASWLHVGPGFNSRHLHHTSLPCGELRVVNHTYKDDFRERSVPREAPSNVRGEVGQFDVDWRAMHYVYILRLQNGQHYVGSTADLEERVVQHGRGEACRTTARIPMNDVAFFAAFQMREKAEAFERYLKSSSGFAFRNKRLI